MLEEYANETLSLFRIKLVRERKLGFKPEVANNPSSSARILSSFFKDKDREHFVVLAVDVKLHLLGLHVVAIGTLDKVLISPREVFKFALLCNAGGVILGHNHPSGDPSPSSEDLSVTRQMVQAGKHLEISVHDHLIIADKTRWVSLRETHPHLFD